MKVAKTLQLRSLAGSDSEADSKANFRQVDADFDQLFTALQGRISFGSGSGRGENISGEFATFTSDGSADTEFSISHTLGSIPIGYLILCNDKAGDLYQGPSTGTAWTSDTIYLKSTGTSVTYLVFLLK